MVGVLSSHDDSLNLRALNWKYFAGKLETDEPTMESEDGVMEVKNATNVLPLPLACVRLQHH